MRCTVVQKTAKNSMIFNERKTGCYFFTIFVYCTVIILICAARCSQMQQFFVFILILTFWLKIAVMRIDFLRKHEQLKKKTYSSSPFVCASWETVIVGWVGLSPDLDTRPWDIASWLIIFAACPSQRYSFLCFCQCCASELY